MVRKRNGVNKLIIWRGLYLDRDSPGFCNGFKAAKLAGYKGNDATLRAVGSSNVKKSEEIIVRWLDEEGLSETALKAKLMSLLEAKETKFFVHEGRVTEEREIEALETQRKTLDMALKVRGMYAPKEYRVDGDLKWEIEVIKAQVFDVKV